MKLYTFDAAPNPARVGMFMQYKGISLDTIQIDLGAPRSIWIVSSEMPLYCMNMPTRAGLGAASNV